MKPTILILLTLFTLTLRAQPKPDASLAPVIGTRCFVSTGNTGSYTVPSFGANQTWDYSALGSATVGNTLTRIEAQGPRTDINTLMGSYSTVTHRLGSFVPGDTSHTYQYRYTDTVGVYEAGTFGQATLRQNPRPQFVLKFGLNLGQMHIDSSLQSHYDSLGTTLMRQVRYRDTSTYLGYGTLTLPNGDVYQNALLTKRGFFGRTDTGNYTAVLVDSYDWYVPNGTGFPVFTIITDPGFAPLYFYSRNTITTIETASPRLELSLAPNPTCDQFMIRGLLPHQSIGIRIISAEGKEALRFDRLPALSRINVAQLPPGVYSVLVSSADGLHTLRFEKE